MESAAMRDTKACEYGFVHPEKDTEEEMRGFRCDQESHARAAVFGSPRYGSPTL